MALLFIESFDTPHTTSKPGVTGTFATSNLYGYTNNGAYIGDLASSSNYVVYPTPGDDTVIFGCWVKVNTIGNGYAFQVRKGTGDYFNLRFTTLTNVNFYINDSAQSLAGGTIPSQDWFHLEVKAYLHASAGTLEMKINGSTTNTHTGLNTVQGRGDGLWDNIEVGADAAYWVDSMYIDDFYIMDGTGTINNNMIGSPTSIVVSRPNGTGNSSQLVGSDGDSNNNWKLVADSADVTYNAGQPGDKDTYQLSDINSAAAYGVYVTAGVQSLDMGEKSIRPVLRSSGTDYAGATGIAPRTGGAIGDVWSEDPAGGAWSQAKINALEAGVEVV